METQLIERLIQKQLDPYLLQSPNKRSASSIAIINVDGNSFVIKIRKRRTLLNSLLFLHGLWEERFIWRENFRNLSDLSTRKRRERENLLDKFWQSERLPAREKIEINLNWADVYRYIEGTTLANIIRDPSISIGTRIEQMKKATTSLEGRHRLATSKDNHLYIPTDPNPNNIIIRSSDGACVWIDSENCVDYSKRSTYQIATSSLKWFLLQLVDFSDYLDFKIVLREVSNSYKLTPIRMGLVDEVTAIKSTFYFRTKAKLQTLLFQRHLSHRYDLYEEAIRLVKMYFSMDAEDTST